MALEARHGFLDMLERRRTGTGHAGHRDVIDEAGAAVEYHRKALVIGGRGGQADEVDACGLGRVAEVFVVLRRQVDHDQAVDAGFHRLGDEALHAHLVDGVEVAHQHDRGGLVVLAEFSNHLQRLGQVLLGGQGADVGQLDRRAVGHRVGEGHAQFDDVGTRGRQALEDLQRGGVVRIAGGDEGHQCGAVLLFQLVEARLQAAHICSSCSS